MGFSIIENNNTFDMIYININERISDKDFFKNNSETVTKNNSLFGEKRYKINNFSKNNSVECFQIVSKDKLEVLLTFKGLSLQNISNLKRLKLKGLNEDSIYISKETNEIFSGGALMHLGVHLEKLFGNYSGNVIHLKKL